ncbi:MAG: right-handed parallel beta-helix repeat-containing protein [Saprospiraceae bacterium]
MKKMISIVIALLSIFHGRAQVSYYVDGTNGNDNNTGTSLSQAWQSIQNAFDKSTPASTVYIRGGTYHENIYANVSGTEGHPIRFRNYQSEVVILDGAGTSESDMLYIEDQSNIIVENITVQHKVGNNATGVTISCTRNASVSNITLRNLKITGINWSSNPNAQPTPNDNSNPLLVSGEGINQVNAITNIVIDSCEVFNNITGYSESISLDGNVDGFVVSHNLIHDNKNIGIHMGGNYRVSSNPEVDHSRNGTCILNTCFNNISNYATSGGIYVDGGKNIIIERNISFGNGFGIEIGSEEDGITSGITVRDNVIYNNKEAGLAMGGYTTATTGQVLNSNVLNNSFLKNDYSNSGTGEVYITKMSNCTIQNNIFYTNEQSILISKDNIAPFNGNSINYNCWFTPDNNSDNIKVTWGNTTYTVFSNYVAQTGMDINSIYADPEFIDGTAFSPDFHLQNTSTCIDRGDPSFVAVSLERDFYGEPRIINSRVDIGASEYSMTSFVSENNKNMSVFVYPNPIINESIILFSPELENARMQIYTMMGEEIETLESIFGNQLLINRNKLMDGVYFIRVSQDNKVIALSKIVVSH